MPVTVITSADAGAPTLSGEIGSLIPVLDFTLVSSLGWTKAFSGTNKAVYKASAVEASSAYLQIDDSTTKYAAVRGYETMSAVDTGTNPFPTLAQVSAPGLYFYKSTTSNSVDRPWQLISDGILFYLFVEFMSSGSAEGNVFGDILSFKAGDAGHALLIANTSASASSIHSSSTNQFPKIDGACVGHYLARNYAQIPGAVAASKYGHRQTSTMGVNTSPLPYPAPVDNGLYLTPVEIWESATLRGLLPGLYSPVNAAPGTHGDLITDIPDLPGRVLKVINTNSGRALIDLTGPWR